MMGTYLGKLKRLYRPIRNFNVEERAMKSISQEKRAVAPPYPSMEKIMEDIKKDPELLTKGKLSKEILDNLSKVFVTSQGDNATIIRKISDLPQERRSSVDYLYGYDEPSSIRPGKVTLRGAIDLITKHQEDKEKNTVETLSKDYTLDIQNVHNIITHFKTFEILENKPEQIPKERNPFKLLQQKIDNVKE